MIAILSPAKNMTSAPIPGVNTERPYFIQEAVFLCRHLCQYHLWELERDLKINSQLAMKAYTDFHSFDPNRPGSPAVFSYRGLAYQHLNSSDFSAEDLDFAQEHLRILSAFYGILKPKDGIQPYRLEFLSKIKPNGKSLYAFWGERVCQKLLSSRPLIINLASAEYSKLIIPYLSPDNSVITCEFLVHRRGKQIALATESKMARGEMARFIVKNRLTQPESLHQFQWNGYQFSPQQSTKNFYRYLKSE